MKVFLAMAIGLGGVVTPAEAANAWSDGTVGAAIVLHSVPEDADFDNDGDVDGIDFLAWQRGLRTSGANNSHGDADGDGDVDHPDLVIWKSQFGKPLAAPVAEPTSVGLAGAAMLLVAVGRRLVRRQGVFGG